jgi:uncharacterized membrane protein
MHNVFLFLAAFLASSVEMVEALTIVLAVGVTRGWRSTLTGVALATIALAAVVAALGPALTAVPINGLRVVVGGLLLIFGLQWLRKAILRASGFKAIHDEEAAFEQQREEAERVVRDTTASMDWYSFTLAFKGVFLEGLEVAFIVVTFGSTEHNVGLAAVAAAAALAAVAALGLLIHAPLSRVPENTLKLAVGMMLTTFGIFWGAEGAGVHWPGADASLFGILAFVVVLSAGLIANLRSQHQRLVGQTQ